MKRNFHFVSNKPEIMCWMEDKKLCIYRSGIFNIRSKQKISTNLLCFRKPFSFCFDCNHLWDMLPSNKKMVYTWMRVTNNCQRLENRRHWTFCVCVWCFSSCEREWKREEEKKERHTYTKMSAGMRHVLSNMVWKRNEKLFIYGWNRA